MNLPRWARATLLPVIGGLLLAGGLLLGAPAVRAESAPTQLAVPSDPEGNKVCLECHAKDQTMTQDGKTVSVHVDSAEYTGSVHGILSCARCHAEITPDHLKDPKNHANLPTGRDLRVLKSEGCVKCHAGAVEQSYKASFHGVAVASGDNRAATCVDCHGVHNVQAASTATSTVAPGNLAKTCGTGECHQNVPASFAEGKEHTIPADADKSPAITHYVYKFFMILILFDVMKDGPIVMFELLRRLQAGRGH